MSASWFASGAETCPATLRRCCVQLLLDSSGHMLVAALAKEDRVLAQAAAASASPAGRDIAAMVAGLLDGRSIHEVDAIGVGVGPGSFIGTRVAVCFANGIAAAGAVPLHPIPTLAAFAAGQDAPCIALRD